MRKLYAAATILAALLVSPSLVDAASPAAPAAGANATTTTTLNLAAADTTKLKGWIDMQKTASVNAPAGVTVAIGTTLPATIMLHPIAASAGVAAAGMNEYAVIDNKIVLVNPTDRKIVYVFS